MPILNKRKSFIANTGVFFFFAMLLSIGVTVVAYRSVRIFEARTVWVEHTHTVLQRLEETHSTLRDLVANARGYALSGHHDYLLSFEADRTALFELLDGLRVLQIDNQAQLDRLARLSADIAKRVELARTLLEVDKNAQIDNIHAHGHDLSEDIRKQFVQLKEVEKTVLAQRSVETKKSIGWTVFAIVSGSIVSLVILLAVYVRLRREMQIRQAAQMKEHIYATELADLYNHAPCGYHSIEGENGLIVQMNDTELAWLGYAREQVIGKLRQADLLTPDSAERYRSEIWPRFLRDKSVSNIDLDYQRADGTHFSALMSARMAQHPETGHMISRSVIYDISERKQTEREIEALNANLKRHAQHLSNINKELESFSYSVSHDLRAPLRAISGYAMMVEEDYADALDEKGRELLQVIGRNVKKMDALINDLLRLSRSSMGELSLGTVSTEEIVEQCIKGLRREYGNVEFIVGPLDGVIANRGMLVQVWENLLGNAAKFSSKQEQPVVRVSARGSQDEVVFQVSDNGVGFDMRYVHKLFGTFQRLHKQEDFPGSGIGLALVQRIVVRHNGRVWADSTPGEGASFYFSLPRTQPDFA
ncbi:sensor histidine kinase [Herbaspirillum rhizosphaerae]|uniref:sensor histidine kinase n=1 Tax=Herbaspirillum rhizosphaerae TaxID=346179 RepID=UPI00067BB1DF|nr:ATP-binding protein [Herbaspirillum rhizosphaerae]